MEDFKIALPDANLLEQKVAEAIFASGPEGANWAEIHVKTGLPLGTISPRFAPLRRKNIIKPRTDEQGNVVKRRGLNSRRNQTVWVAA